MCYELGNSVDNHTLHESPGPGTAKTLFYAMPKRTFSWRRFPLWQWGPSPGSR